MWTLTDLIILLLSSVSIILLLSSWLPRLRMYLSYRKLPPGPVCWPLLGYTPFLDKENNYKSLKELSGKYGGVVGLHVGSRYVVVLDDFEAVKDSFQREEFLARPEGCMKMCPDTSQVGVLDMSGQQWREHKKFWLSSMRHMTSGHHDVRHVIASQIQEVVVKLHETEGQDVRVDHMLELALNNIPFYLLFGKTFPQDHSLIQFLGQYDSSLLKFLDLNGLKMLFPWLGKLVALLPQYRSVERDLDRMDREIKKEILEHQKTLDDNDSRDFVDLFMLRMQKPGSEEHYSMSKLLGTAKELLLAATESTRNSMVWFIMLMAKYSEIQEKIQKQIDSVLGGERAPRLEDRTHLPLLDAAIMESLRFKNIINLSLPREVLWDTKVQGYDIPKDTIVFYNMSSHFRNPKLWNDPDKFDPSRFLSPDRNAVQVPEHFIPFSYGKRTCIGEKIANSTLFIFSATLLQKFKVKPPEGGINLNIKINFTNGQERPVVKFVSRTKH